MAFFKTELTLTNINDGAPGATGAPGAGYLIETNQDEILKFYDDEGKQTLSPNQLTVKISKVTEELAKVQTLSQNNLEFSYLQDGAWVILGPEIWESQEVITGDTTVIYDAIVELDATQTTATFNFNKIDSIYYANLYSQIFLNESGLRIRYQQNGILLALKIIGVRYGMNSEMARLSLKADGIYASIASSKLNFDANGLSVYNGGIKILKDEYEAFSGNSFEEGVEYYILTGSGYVLTQDAAPQEGIQYYVKNYSTSLSADEQGNLTIVGSVYATNGYFNGEVNATAGTFNGIVNAQGGNFSGEVQIDGLLSIGEQNKIYLGTLQSTTGIFSENYSENGEEGFYFGLDGSIIANNIQLGNSASIKNYLKLGDYSYIYNPSSSEASGRFIVVKDNKNSNLDTISLTQEGKLILGSSVSGIILDGVKQSISSGNFQSGYNGWKIDTDKAEFNHIVARGTIESSVLAYGEVQTIGGVLLVRPSAIIKNCIRNGSSYTITLENSNILNSEFEKLDFCKISDGEQIYQIIEKSENNLILRQINTATTEPAVIQDEEIMSNLIGKILISYGHNANNTEEQGLGDGPIGITINATSSSSFGSPNAISIFKNEFEKGENGDITHTRTPVIIIGEMNGEDDYGGLTGYGLYADNAYLKGALIAASPDDSEIPKYYSGINTTSGVSMPAGENGVSYFPEANVGDILFWAGAQSSDNRDIEKAPFKVDTYGNLYANSGYFEGTIISDATISAAKIRTAVIEGWDLKDNTQAALTIVDAAQAIRFCKTSKTSETGYEEILSLSDEGLTLNVPLITPNFSLGDTISFNQVSIKDQNEISKTETQLNLDELIFIRDGFDGIHKAIVSSKYGDKSLNFFIVDSEEKNSQNSESILSLTQNNTIVKNQTQFYKEIFFGSKGEIEYRFVSDSAKVIGYDIYIKE